MRTDVFAVPTDVFTLPADVFTLPADVLALPADVLTLPADVLTLWWWPANLRSLRNGLWTTDVWRWPADDADGFSNLATGWPLQSIRRLRLLITEF